MEFWTDLAGVQFDEEEAKPVWLQALPLNTYTHPAHGKISITPERVQRFADNVKNRVRETDLDIDYDHKAQRRDAAGWVVDAEARLSDPDPKKNGLWIAVNFTKEATQKLKDKAYRYFSSEFQDKWKHPATNQTYNDVLFGGALTNRPFLKDILPINLSEITGEQPKEGTVDIEKLRQQLNLPETATEDEVVAAVTDLQTQAAANSGTNTGGESGSGAGGEGDGATGGQAQLSDGEEELVKLAEDNPVIKFLLDEREETRTQLAELQKAHKSQSVAKKLSEVTKDAKVTLPPAAIEAATKLSERDDVSVELSDAIFEMLGTVAKTGVVELGERGSSTGGSQNADATKRLSDAVEKHMKENNVDYATALSEVTAKDPSLYENHLVSLNEA